LRLLWLGGRIDPEYAAAASSLGRALALHGFGLVYGGGRVGLMGVVADAVLEGGGRAIGVIPEPLYVKEVAHDGLTDWIRGCQEITMAAP